MLYTSDNQSADKNKGQGLLTTTASKRWTAFMPANSKSNILLSTGKFMQEEGQTHVRRRGW